MTEDYCDGFQAEPHTGKDIVACWSHVSVETSLVRSDETVECGRRAACTITLSYDRQCIPYLDGRQSIMIADAGRMHERYFPCSMICPRDGICCMLSVSPITRFVLGH